MRSKFIVLAKNLLRSLVAYLVVCVKSVSDRPSATSASSSSIYVHNPRRTLYPQRSLAGLALAHAHACPLFFGVLVVRVRELRRVMLRRTTCVDPRSNSVLYLLI